MEVAELRYRRGLLTKGQQRAHRAAYPAADGWSVKEVGRFLNEMGHGKYVDSFKKARVDGRALLQLDGARLAPLMDVAPNELEANEQATELLQAQITLLRRRSPALHDEL